MEQVAVKRDKKINNTERGWPVRSNHRKGPSNPQIKGVFVFNPDQGDYLDKALALLKSMQCQVLSNRENRVTVSATRANLQKIKQSWLSEGKDSLSKELGQSVNQIIIGGNV